MVQTMATTTTAAHAQIRLIAVMASSIRGCGCGTTVAVSGRRTSRWLRCGAESGSRSAGQSCGVQFADGVAQQRPQRVELVRSLVAGKQRIEVVVGQDQPDVDVTPLLAPVRRPDVVRMLPNDEQERLLIYRLVPPGDLTAAGLVAIGFLGSICAAGLVVSSCLRAGGIVCRSYIRHPCPGISDTEGGSGDRWR